MQIAQNEVKTYECHEKLYIKLNDQYATVICSETSIFLMYADFQKYQFINVNCSVNIELDQNGTYEFDQIMTKVLQSLKLTERRDIYFTYYERIDLLEPFIKTIPYKNVEFLMYVDEISEDRCEWRKYFHLIKETSWKIFCFNNHYMFHLNDDNEVVIPIEMSENTGLTLMIILLVLLPIILLSNFFIAKRKHLRVSGI